MLSMIQRRALAITFLIAGAVAAAADVSAQAVPTVERGSAFTPFVQTTIVNPDWGQTRDLGYSAGFDYTHYIRIIVQPSLEFRFTRVTGRTVNETTFLGGFRLQTTIHHIQPYAVLLAGKGIIGFNYDNNGITGDDSAVYGYGGGAEFNVTPLWKVRADFIQQHWNLDPNTLTPTALSFGIGYSVPFHNRGVR
jgi:hypothetical protein